MKHTILLITILLFSLLFSIPVSADHRSDPREQAISDILDLWREGSFDRLYDALSHRTSMTREKFVELIRDSGVRPSCCHRKLNDFRVVSETKSKARVYARIGLEGPASSSDTSSREFVLLFEGGGWKMSLADIKSLAGITKKKKSRSYKVKKDER